MAFLSCMRFLILVERSEAFFDFFLTRPFFDLRNGSMATSRSFAMGAPTVGAAALASSPTDTILLYSHLKCQRSKEG